MTDISLIKRLKTIYDIVSSQSFFITLFIILVLTVIILVINIKVKSKAPRIAAAIIYFGLAVLVLLRYGTYVTSLNDSIVNKFFNAIYFPNLVVYLSMLVLSLLLITITLIDRKFSIITKICNASCFFVIWFLFVLLIDLVKKEGLNFYEVTELYKNESVMILLQASMAIFTLWLGVIIIDLIVRKLANKMDLKEKINKSIPEEIPQYTNEEFNINYLNSKKEQKINSLKELISKEKIKY